MWENECMGIIGIDPGLSGAVALLQDDLLQVFDMPTVEVRGRRQIVPSLLAGVLRHQVDMVVIEHVQGVQGTGATSAFSFGRSFGLAEGLATGLGLPVTLVRPQAWTKALGVSRDKGEHRAIAARLWPRHADLFARVKDDGRADAALLCHWWRLHSRAAFGRLTDT